MPNTTAQRTPEMIKSEIRQLEHQRWHAIFNNEPWTLIQDYDNVLNDRRHEYVHATLEGGKQ